MVALYSDLRGALYISLRNIRKEKTKLDYNAEIRKVMALNLFSNWAGRRTGRSKKLDGVNIFWVCVSNQRAVMS
jgi:hypothetical protein